MNDARDDRPLSTADFAGAAKDTPQNTTHEAAIPVPDEPLAALFSPDAADDFRARWDAVQIGFVDDPRNSVRKADELVAQVMKSLAETFSTERTRLEQQLDGDDAGSGSTENLRVALQRYRSFFQRLLSL
jgi:hypothetical protein